MADVKKRVKSRLPLALIFIILMIGISIFMYPKVSNLISEYTAKVEIGSYNSEVEKLDNSEIEKFEKQAEEYNKSLYEKTDSSTFKYNDLLNVTGILGYVDIPKIKVYVPIYHGMSDEVLQKGIGHMEGTSLPVGGTSTHSVLAGHTGLPSAELFTGLDRLVEGDVFYIHVLNRILAYRVDQIKVVLPENDNDIQIIKGEDYVTLLTCTPYGVNDHRLLVRGTRIPYEEEKQIVDEHNADSDIGGECKLSVEAVLWIIGISVIIFVITVILMILFIPGRKKPEKPKSEKE